MLKRVTTVFSILPKREELPVCAPARYDVAMVRIIKIDVNAIIHLFLRLSVNSFFAIQYIVLGFIANFDV